MSTMDDLSWRYISHLERSAKPKNTIKARRCVLEQISNAGTAEREEIERWYYAKSHLSVATQANQISCLRSFYKWCAREGLRTDDPTFHVEAPKVPNGLPRPIKESDLTKALASVDPITRKCVLLGAHAGLRISESSRLKWSDLDDENMRIAIIDSKGGKSRFVAISQELIDLLGGQNGVYVVSGARSYSPQMLSRKVNRALKKIGISSTSHTLRHYFGTRAYQATGDLLAVGLALGHTSPNATKIYAGANDETARRIAQAVMQKKFNAK